MRFIRKNGRIIPIRDKNEITPKQTKGLTKKDAAKGGAAIVGGAAVAAASGAASATLGQMHFRMGIKAHKLGEKATKFAVHEAIYSPQQLSLFGANRYRKAADTAARAAHRLDAASKVAHTGSIRIKRFGFAAGGLLMAGGINHLLKKSNVMKNNEEGRVALAGGIGAASAEFITRASFLKKWGVKWSNSKISRQVAVGMLRRAARGGR